MLKSQAIFVVMMGTVYNQTWYVTLFPIAWINLMKTNAPQEKTCLAFTYLYAISSICFTFKIMYFFNGEVKVLIQ